MLQEKNSQSKNSSYLPAYICIYMCTLHTSWCIYEYTHVKIQSIWILRALQVSLPDPQVQIRIPHVHCVCVCAYDNDDDCSQFLKKQSISLFRRVEHIEFPAKLLFYFFRSNKSIVNRSIPLLEGLYTHTFSNTPTTVKKQRKHNQHPYSPSVQNSPPRQATSALHTPAEASNPHPSTLMNNLRIHEFMCTPCSECQRASVRK